VALQLDQERIHKFFWPACQKRTLDPVYLCSLGCSLISGAESALQHIKGHAGHEGNEGADRLAGIGAGLPATEERDWTSLEEL